MKKIASLDLYKGLPGYRRSLQPRNENTQNMKFLNFFLFFWPFLIRIPNPDPIRIQIRNTVGIFRLLNIFLFPFDLLALPIFFTIIRYTDKIENKLNSAYNGYVFPMFQLLSVAVTPINCQECGGCQSPPLPPLPPSPANCLMNQKTSRKKRWTAEEKRQVQALRNPVGIKHLLTTRRNLSCSPPRGASHRPPRRSRLRRRRRSRLRRRWVALIEAGGADLR